MHCIEVGGLVHRYAGDTVLRGIDLQVPRGSIYGFLGPNGAGKTTTLRLMLGLLRKQQGTLRVFGRSFDEHRIEILRKVGALIESPSLYDHLTAVENLELLRRVHQCPRRRIQEVLALVDLAGTGGKATRQFSLGMKQRLSIAMALLHSPELLILDEPTNGLDPNGIIEMREFLKRLNREHGITLLISSHLLAEIERLVTDVGIISQGTMRFQGTMGELKQQRHRALAVTLRTRDDGKALRLLTEQGLAVRAEEGQLVLPRSSDGEVAAVNRCLVSHGLDVYELNVARNDLESIFMELIEGVA
ncbi:ABC transporter ATP-binding protein [Stigmatella sp. ncwal1]|uniref:ABC transporter ATP-binding protein n=1 Tax=Stigmatella ashevillensis TaxID=2995309 RepID=A0ABT5DHK3_9BACT|nr:ABC transporter ATP-binding protein [Stigmatella ashevillena]MDC0711841.1 ABC transporter ATP-binding protein [Stigmatella ashevillena]